MATHEWKARMVCAWHKQNFGFELVLREGPEPTSHGMCRECARIETAKGRKLIAEKRKQMEGGGDEEIQSEGR